MSETLLSNRVLMSAPRVAVRVEPGQVVVEVNSRRARFSPVALRLLAEFSTPQTLEGVLRGLHGHGTVAQWMQLTDTALGLYRVGALIDRDAAAGKPQLTSAYGGATVHIRMLNDVARTEAYLQAIAQVVEPGDTVVDIGTGTGILALAAARAGASRVYAIESTAIADVAEAMFHSNGYADRITVMRGWSTDIDLPQRADVLVAELVGDDPFNEQIVELTADAKRRLLVPHPRLIPAHLQLYGVLVELPDDRLARHRFDEPALSRWSALYGFDFSSLSLATAAQPLHLRLTPGDSRALNVLSEPFLITSADFRENFSTEIDVHKTVTCHTPGTANAVLTYFDVNLAAGCVLSTAPDRALDSNHWGNRALMLPKGRQVRPGESIPLHLERRQGSIRVTFGSTEHDS